MTPRWPHSSQSFLSMSALLSFPLLSPGSCLISLTCLLSFFPSLSAGRTITKQSLEKRKQILIWLTMFVVLYPPLLLSSSSHLFSVFSAFSLFSFLSDFLSVCVGWTITKQSLEKRKQILILLAVFVVLYLFLLVWAIAGRDPADTLYLYESAPGKLDNRINEL